jgi:hypothetical protein
MAWRIVVEDWVASAIGSFFVALGEAIVAWGMQLVGTVPGGPGAAHQRPIPKPSTLVP